jgi:hypothetical protein
MWSGDAPCSRCEKKKECRDKVKILQTLSPLINELNTLPEHVDGPGDGLLVVACQDFTVIRIG